MGFTLGACIALQYAMDYPEEVNGLVLMTVAMRPKERGPGTLELRQRAAEDPAVYQEWWELQRGNMMFVDADLRERLMECHAKVGPLSQLHDLIVIDQFDVRDRIGTLQPPLLLIRGLDDPGKPLEYELEIHQAVPGSRYLKLEVNQAIEELLKSLSPML